MATTILLARHGETAWNRERRWQGHADPPLNETGLEQARGLAEELATPPPWTQVYSSDLRRARETAEPIAAALRLPVRTDPRLREIDVGEWSGLTSEEVERLYPGGATRRREGATGWESGESYEAMAERVLEALRVIAGAHPHERVVVVTHGGPMRAVWRAIGGTTLPAPRYHNCAIEQISVQSGRIGWIHSRQGGGLHQQVQG